MNVIEEVYDFYEKFQGKKGIIGYTQKGKPIVFLFVGSVEKHAIISSYCIHAREFITSYLALEQISFMQKQNFNGGVYFLPLINVDGVEICLNGNPNYKANARMVDLNTNFDADFGKGYFNRDTPNFENYVGKFPFSEKETQAMRDFTLKIKPIATLSYHSKGEEIYFDFKQPLKDYLKDKQLAQIIQRETGYKIVENLSSCGGFKDWCIQKLKIPAFTIEVGSDSFCHPILKEQLKEIKEKNLNTILKLLNELNGRK